MSKTKPLKEVLTLAEAAYLWKLSPDTLRHVVHRGKFNKDETRKTNSPKGEWLILKSAMIRLYGEVDGNETKS